MSFGGGKAPQSQKTQPVGALNVQTSVYGAAKPLLYGQNRVPINLIHFFNFKPIPHTEKQQSGGKGGPKPQSTTSYTYQVACALAFGQGDIVGTGIIWKSKEKYTIAELGFTLFNGAAGQVPWAYLASALPAQAVPYANTSYLAHAALDLGDSPSLPNFNVEYKGYCQYGSGIVDALPSDIITDYLTHARHGAGFGTYLADLDAGSNSFRKYCLARGLFISPIENNQRQAGVFVKEMAEICNSAVVWRAGKLNIIPYGDTAITGNGATYTPDLTPKYSLTVDDFQFEQGQPPVKHSAKNPSEAYNHVRVEYNARSNDYNPLIVEVKDQADIDDNGLNTKAVAQYKAITLESVARDVAQLQMQRDLFVVNTYAFRLGIRHSLLEPMDLLELTEPGLGLDRQLTRVIEANELDDALDVVVEEMNVGAAHAPLFNTQTPLGYNADMRIDPGVTRAPIIMNAPGLLTKTGYEMWVAVTGINLDAWGGCAVWVSDDDLTYERVGEVLAPARYGSLNAAITAGTADHDTTTTPQLALYNGQMLSVTQAACDAWRTLLYIGGEWMAYRDATLVSGSTYNVHELHRAGYGSARASHALGAAVAVIDKAIFKLPYDGGNVGKTVYFKFTSFNVYGLNAQDLADVPSYSHVIGASDLTAPVMNDSPILTDLQTQITDAQTDANTAIAALTDISNDNLLTPGEKPVVIKDRDTITGEQAGIDAQATSYSITTEKTTYDNAVSALTTYLATLTSPVLWSTLTGNTTIVGTTFRQKFIDVYTARQALLNKIYANAKVKADAAQSTANTALTNAGNAQTDATSALNQLTDISSDSLLTPGEKPQVIKDRDAITAEQAGIDAQATAFAIGTEKTNYDSAVTALTTYLATLTTPVLWSTLTGNTTIVGTTFRQKFLDVYSTKQILLNKIYATAKAIADGKITTYQQATAPYTSGGVVGDLWTDTDTNVIARWDGGTWVSSAAYVATANGANLIANSTFSSNLMGFASGALGLNNKQMVDGWYCTVQADANTSLAYCSWSPGIIRCQVSGPVVVPASGQTAPQVRTLSPFSVDPGAVYSCDFNAVYAFNGALNAGIAASARMLIRWLDAAGAQISIVAITRARGTAAGWGGWTDFTAPTNAVTAVVFLDVFVTNSNGTPTTACTSSVALQANFVAVAMIKKSLLAIPGSGVQVGDTRNLPQIIIGNGTAKVPTVVSYTAAAGTPATATISVAAFTILSGSVNVSYGAKTVGVTGTNNTTVTYFLYLDDPTYSGTGTLVATTNGNTVYGADGRLFIGTCAVTYPATGSGSGGGTGGGRGGIDSCVCVDMALNDEFIAVDAKPGMLLDCIDMPTTGDTPFRRRIRAVEFANVPCVEITTDTGAVWRGARTTPFDLLDGRVVYAPEMLGEYVLGDKGIGTVTKVVDIGEQPVAHIHLGGISYAAGEDPRNRIYSHNALKP